MIKQLNSCKAFYDYDFLQSYREVVRFTISTIWEVI